MDTTLTENEVRDLGVLKQKLGAYAAQASKDGQKVGFFYAKPEDRHIKQVEGILEIILSGGFRRHALTEEGAFIGVHVPGFGMEDYKILGAKVAGYASQKDVKLGTSSTLSLESNASVAIKRLDDLADLSRKEGEHKHLE